MENFKSLGGSWPPLAPSNSAYVCRYISSTRFSQFEHAWLSIIWEKESKKIRLYITKIHA